jgi:undecaprenyl-diphosphatase
MDTAGFFISHILPKMQHLGYWSYWIALGISLLESLAFVGIIFPGTTLIVIIGFLSPQIGLDIGDLIWFCAIGAFIGDSVSYWLGRKGKNYFPGEGKLLRQNHFAAAEDFFERHGNKSIFLGRFVGPLRPIVPFVAGFLKMNIGSFLFWNIASAFAWAATHLLAGYFFGGIVGSFVRISKWIGIAGGVTAAMLIAWVLLRSKTKS